MKSSRRMKGKKAVPGGDSLELTLNCFLKVPENASCRSLKMKLSNRFGCF